MEKLSEMLLAGPPREPAKGEPERDQDLEDAFDDFENKSLSKSARMDALFLLLELKA